MRSPIVALGLALLAACGDDQPSNPIIDAPEGDAIDPIDANPNVDAPRLLPDAAVATCTPRNGTTIVLEPFVTGLVQPVGLSSAPGDARVFVIEQPGRVRVIKNGALLPTPFLDLREESGGPVLDGGERGLLGIAFHPDFRDNDRFYVNYTRLPDGDTVIAEYRATFGTDVADPGTGRIVLVIDQPFSNHNGGWIEFGTDGMLYVGMGDGGSSNDPGDRAQDDTEMLGKMVRIDVDTRTGTKQYGIPANNPFASSADGPNDPRPENWHKGLRNPFRFSFDTNGDLYIGDVGQGAWEEVDVAVGNAAGVNWGWDDREGAHCFEPMNGCLTAGRTDPVSEHPASANWHSVIGGAVYRGSCFPDLVGQYFYGDYSAGELWAFRMMNGAAQNDRRVLQNVGTITSIQHDATGELYVVTHNGTVRRITVP